LGKSRAKDVISKDSEITLVTQSRKEKNMERRFHEFGVGRGRPPRLPESIKRGKLKIQNTYD
jgi:hypothetical protein